LEALSAFSLLLTEVSLANLAPTDAAVTSLLFRETPRSFVRLSTDQLPAAREFAAESFRDMLSL
jgi:hypothetical protein